MTRIVLDADLRSKLLNLTEPLELCDEAGKVVGRVFPAVDLSEWELTEPPFGEEELRRRETSDEPRYSLREVLEQLRKL